MRLHLNFTKARLATLAGLVAAGTLLAPTAPTQANTGIGTKNMTHVANLGYEAREYPLGDSFAYDPSPANNGTDLETTTLTVDGEQRDFAIAGSYRNGLQLVDVTDPTQPVIAQTFDCGIAQGDVQIIKRDGRTYVAYAQDDIPSEALYTSTCYVEALALRGLTPPPTAGDADAIKDRFGTFIIDVTNPYVTEGADRVRVVGQAKWAMGSHNSTVSPDGMWLYNSNQDLVPKVPVKGQSLYQIEVFSLADLTNPVKVAAIPLNTGAGPHDITFSSDGTRAYVAAISHSVVIDTTNPAAPKVIGVIEDPAISIHHQADPIDFEGRRLLVVSDELAGVIEGAVACPGGGLHVYDVTGSLEKAPLKVGAFFIPEVAPPAQTHHRCTAHVFKYYPETRKMTVAWYGAGVRVLDLSELAVSPAGVSAGVATVAGSVGHGIQEVASFYFTQSDDETIDGSQTWAAKVHRWDEDGSAYIFANDLDRGFDVYRFDANAPKSMDPGTWVDGQMAKLPKVDPTPPALPEGASSSNRQDLPYCVLLARS
jgi:hypothetical protein